MQLSDGERLILVMLAELYQHHKIKGEIDPELVLSSIFKDKTWGLKWEYGSIFRDSEGGNPPAVQETCDILDMFRILTPSYEKLSDEDKARVQREAAPFGDDYKFQGFDGNNDEHYGIAGYLVEDLERYGELNKHNLNSHSSTTLPTYRRMLAQFNRVKLAPKYELNADQIISILKP